MYRIRTDILHGNAALVSLVEEEGIPTIRFSADPHGGTETLWWCLRMERTRGDAPAAVRLVWRHFRNCLGLGPDAPAVLHPVVRHDGGPWRRLPAGITRERADGCPAAVWEFEAPEAWAECAFCFPHGPAEIDDLARRTGWQRTGIGVSSGGRKLVRVANAFGEPKGERPGVYCVGHQHGSEMSGAWALHGFLFEMADRGNAAPMVWSVPVAAVDETLSGDYGKDPFPWDLNRAWGHPPMRAEVLAIMRDIAAWQQRCRPVLCIDFHSPGGAELQGVYTFLMDPDTDPESHSRGAGWAEAIAAELEHYAAPDFNRVARYPSRFTSNQHSSFTRFYNNSGIAALTFEIPYHRVGDRVLELSDYIEIGRRMARAVCQRIAAGES